MSANRTISISERRRALVARHYLAGTAIRPMQATKAMVALHASDPASVYLSVLARCSSCTVVDVARAMYERRSLVRWLAMRRTLFVFDRDDVPLVQAAVGDQLAASLRSQLIDRLRRNGTEPDIVGEVADWVELVSDEVVQLLDGLGSATGTELAAAAPRLRTSIAPRTASERPQNLTTGLLTVLSAEGRIVRGAPTGAWTSRQHRWEPLATWWPDGLPAIDTELARRTLARRWLQRFGPATVEDLKWWTGWSMTSTRQALAGIAIEDVDLHGHPGIDLLEHASDAAVDPVATLLPALDPTPMGWKNREWFFDIDPREVFDAAGNIGPTIWWDGCIIGSWAVGGDGEIRIGVPGDHGADATAAVRAAAEHLHRRLDGAVVTPAVRTPLEHRLLD